jgi:hypothetical protein
MGVSDFATVLRDSTSTSYNYLNVTVPGLPSDKAKSKTEGLISKNKDEATPFYKASTVPQERNLSELSRKADTVNQYYRGQVAGVAGVTQMIIFFRKQKPGQSRTIILMAGWSITIIMQFLLQM